MNQQEAIVFAIVIIYSDILFCRLCVNNRTKVLQTIFTSAEQT